MVDATVLKTKIESRVFDNLGSSATLTSVTKGTPDKWGDATDTDSSSTVTIVAWNHIFGRQNYQPFGDLQEGEIDIAIKSDETIGLDDEITFNGKVYKVKVVEHYILKDINLVKVARLVEEL